MAKKKKAQGRAGQKGKAQKAKGTVDNYDDPWSDHHTPVQAFKDARNPHKGFNGFSQNSPNAASLLGSSIKLRHQNIAFVNASASASTSNPTPTDDPELLPDAEHNLTVDDNPIRTNLTTDMEHDFNVHMHIRSAEELQQLDGGDDTLDDAQDDARDEDDIVVTGMDGLTSDPLFVVDTVGDPSLRLKSHTKVKQPTMREPSPSPSSSSEEVVFHGRSTVIDDPPVRRSTTHPRKANAPVITEPPPHITDDLLAALETPSIQPPPPDTSRSSFRLIKATAPQPEEAWSPAPEYPYWRKGTPPDTVIHAPGPAGPMLWEETAEKNPVPQQERSNEAEQTITSLQAELRERLVAKRAVNRSEADAADFEPLGSSASKTSRRGKRGRKKSNRLLSATVAEDKDVNSPTEAAYDDYMANLAAQMDSDSLGGDNLTDLARLAQSEFLAGPSLVVDGREIGEDEVLDKHHTTEEWEDASSSDSDAIDEDLDISNFDSSDLEDELDYTLRQQWDDEDDLRQRRLERMTDEQMARLFAKQQELGIDCNDLLIDDGGLASDAQEFGDLAAARAALPQLTGTPTGRSIKSRTRRKNGGPTFPDATALADIVDQYGDAGFDIMDFDRPSLRPTKKGRKGQLPPELEALSDDDFKNSMFDTFEKDRAKKRERKAAREQLRTEGMLGSSGKKGKADLSIKYIEGMTMAQVRDELRIFLQDEGQHSRPFPPMDKKDRKTLHEIASAFNLKSKSVGTGKNRFPVLNKTSSTTAYSEAQFTRVMAASSRGFLRVSGAGKGFGGKGGGNKFKPRGGQGGGFSSAATGLRNGEIVGAHAAEIGKDSFGHKMMEKMGWSKGMALGKDGEGMLLPVAQVMRSGKAGLG